MPSDGALAIPVVQTHLRESIEAIDHAQEALTSARASAARADLAWRLLVTGLAGDPALDEHEAEVRRRLAEAPDDPFPDAVSRDELLREAHDRFGS